MQPKQSQAENLPQKNGVFLDKLFKSIPTLTNAQLKVYMENRNETALNCCVKIQVLSDKCLSSLLGQNLPFLSTFQVLLKTFLIGIYVKYNILAKTCEWVKCYNYKTAISRYLNMLNMAGTLIHSNKFAYKNT